MVELAGKQCYYLSVTKDAFRHNGTEKVYTGPFSTINSIILIPFYIFFPLGGT